MSSLQWNSNIAFGILHSNNLYKKRSDQQLAAARSYRCHSLATCIAMCETLPPSPSLTLRISLPLSWPCDKLSEHIYKSNSRSTFRAQRRWAPPMARDKAPDRSERAPKRMARGERRKFCHPHSLYPLLIDSTGQRCQAPKRRPKSRMITGPVMSDDALFEYISDKTSHDA